MCNNAMTQNQFGAHFIISVSGGIDIFNFCE